MTLWKSFQLVQAQSQSATDSTKSNQKNLMFITSRAKISRSKNHHLDLTKTKTPSTVKFMFSHSIFGTSALLLRSRLVVRRAILATLFSPSLGDQKNILGSTSNFANSHERDCPTSPKSVSRKGSFDFVQLLQL